MSSGYCAKTDYDAGDGDKRKLASSQNWGNLDICINPRMCEFSIQNRQNISTVWLPKKPAKAIPPRIIQPTKKYYTHIGMIPHYTGFIPQYQYRCGATYGALSKNVLGE